VLQVQLELQVRLDILETGETGDTGATGTTGATGQTGSDNFIRLCLLICGDDMW